jgi:hypothetical protein
MKQKRESTLQGSTNAFLDIWLTPVTFMDINHIHESAVPEQFIALQISKCMESLYVIKFAQF